MAHEDPNPEEAMTKEEIEQIKHDSQPSRPRNAFTELMSARPKGQPSAKLPTPGRGKDSRSGLSVYLRDPSAEGVIYYNENAILISDKFPKATVHCLLLPRSEPFTHLHPFDAMDDAEFRGLVVREVERAKELVAKELQRRLGRFSKAEAEREAVLNGETPPSPSGSLPKGRDWLSELRVGFHAQPSMAHLHVHIFSRDMHSPCLKHKKHYNSFNTPFLVPLGDFPLDEQEQRERKSGWLAGGMRCWRCGRVFERSFVGLREHLEEEFEEWKRE